MSANEQVERGARVIYDMTAITGGHIPMEDARRYSRAVIRAAMTPPSQTLRRALGALHVVEEDHYGRYCKSCSAYDRRVSDPCPTHRVLREFDMGNLPELPDSSPHDAWDEGFATGVDAGGRYMQQGGLDSCDLNPYREPTQ